MGIPFIKGHLYFMYAYDDENLRVPSIESLVFVGKNLEKGEDETWYFQDALSYELLGSYPEFTKNVNKKGNVTIHTFSDVDVHRIKDLKGLMEELKECLLRRGGK